MNALFSLVFVAGPALLMFYFWLPEWNDNKYQIPIGYLYLSAFGLVIFTFLATFLFVYLGLISFDALRFSLPLALAFAVILVSSFWPTWVRAFAVILTVMFAWPINGLISRFNFKR